MADQPPRKWQFEIHTDRFLLWEIRQARWQIYPPENDNLRFILIDSYSESSGRPDGRSTPPLRKWQFQIHTDRFLLWELRQIKWQIKHPVKGQFEIHTDRFLLWALRQTKWQIYPPRKWQFEIHTDRFLLWELRQVKWQIYPPRKRQFQIHTDRFLLWELRQTRWQDHVADLPPRKWQFEIHTDRFLLFRAQADQMADLPPPENGNFRFILIDSYSESSGRPDGRSNPQKMAIWDSYW